MRLIRKRPARSDARPHRWRGPGRGRLGIALSFLVVFFSVLALAGGGSVVAVAGPGPSWWMVDTHEHSAFSGDARADIGIDAQIDKNLGYNAVFLTDHDRMSSFQVSNANGNYLSFDESLTNWTPKQTGTGTAPALATSPSPVEFGTHSLHLSATGTKAGSSFAYVDRGPGLRSGDINLDFWVYPVLSGAAGADVSVSLGGDKTTGQNPFGYTTVDGTPNLGKSTVLVWELGNARTPSTGTTHVIVNPVKQWTSGVWNHYIIDVTSGSVYWSDGTNSRTDPSAGLSSLVGTADEPAPYDTLALVKLEAAVNTSGSADVYFDNLTAETASPICPAAEFVYRDQLIDTGAFNSSTFTMYPAREMGQTGHSNQFNFDLTDAHDFNDTAVDAPTRIPDAYGDDAKLCQLTNTGASARWQYASPGYSNILSVQQSGYPVQMNHPGVTDDVNDLVAHQDYGADFVEVRTGADYSSPWDRVLAQNHPIIGTYGTDAHLGVSTNSANTPADFIDAPSTKLNDLLHGVFEGRSFMAPIAFGPGQDHIVFNLDPNDDLNPYPARYPVYVPSTQGSATVHLSIDGGLKSGETVRWFTSSNGSLTTVPDPQGPDKNGVVQDVPFAWPLRTDSVQGSTYDSGPVSVPLAPGFPSFTYVRAAVYNSAGALLANTQPIFFEAVSAMPAGMTARIDAIASPAGPVCDCNALLMKGISSTPTFNSSTLTIPLTNPAGSGVSMIVDTAAAPSSVKIDGSTVTPASSLSAYQTVTGTSWFYDAAATRLYVRDVQAAGTSNVAISFGAAQTPPTIPQNLHATAASSSEIDLSWSGSTDIGGPGLAGYHVYRNGGASPIASVPAGQTTYNDTGLSPSTAYTYTVAAYDTASNESDQSTSAQATTQAGSPTALVQQKTATGSTATLQVSLIASSTPGDALVATIALAAGSSATVNTVIDSSGAAWLKGAVGFLSGTNSRVEVWYRVGATSISSVTVTLSAAKAAAVNVSEWSGIATTTPLDGPALGGSNAAATSASTPTLPTANTTDLIVGAINYPAAATAALSGGGFTDLSDFVSGSSVHGHAGYVVTAAAGSYHAAWNLSASSGGSGGVILALKATGGGGSDTTKPSVPQNLQANPAGSSEIDLSWNPSTDSGGSGLAGYRIYRNGGGAPIATVPSGQTTYSNTGLTPSTTYTYTVSAYDNAANESAQSGSAQATTSGAGGGSIAFVQQKVASGTGATLTASLNVASTGGDALVATIALAAGSSASVSSVSDSAGGTWIKGPAGFLSGTNSRVEIWYRLGAPAVSSVTATLSAAKSAALNVSEWSGVATLDRMGQGSNPSGTVAATPTIATTNGVDVVIGAINYPAAATATLASNGLVSLSDFTSGTTVHGRAAYVVTTTTGSYSASWNLSAASGGSGGVIVALKAS